MNCCRIQRIQNTDLLHYLHAMPAKDAIYFIPSGRELLVSAQCGQTSYGQQRYLGLARKTDCNQTSDTHTGVS
jgi:hypothetical protein